MPQARFVIQTVCHGNICRSPMAAAVLRSQLHDADLDSFVAVASSGTSSEEHGHAIDPRAARALARRGYEVDRKHRAHRITPDELASADLVLPATLYQAEWLVRRGVPAGRVKLLRQFDPAFAGRAPTPAMELDDPWYGTEEDFETVLNQIETAAPGVVEYVHGRVN
ncbi:MAG: low molecular weight phosphotyrosine protein phosphatase [Bifidobacteriaceae bacterium]|jgi:protein-tyrosine phosphatase|nr:low molecular weight phosphotyrosine protein phosphatase [Bifidobacteriaceae bacterium]